MPRLHALLLIALFLVGCGATTGQAPASTPTQGYEVVTTYPHDPQAFTEGLFWKDGFLWESTGLVGRSDIRRVNLADGRVVQKVDIPRTMFGEGIVDWGDEIISLTWRDRVGFRWNRRTLEQTGSFPFTVGEGWGMTRSDREIFESDGSSVIHVLDPQTMRETRRIEVAADGIAVDKLNELEWVDGEIYANVWMTSLIARIDPASGRVLGWIDLTGLANENAGADQDAVLNGIAWDAQNRRLFVTGKLWRHLYEIRLTPAVGTN
jgi:glutamine cyclotransferase